MAEKPNLQNLPVVKGNVGGPTGNAIPAKKKTLQIPEIRRIKLNLQNQSHQVILQKVK